jgi:hypothetical protein
MAGPHSSLAGQSSVSRRGRPHQARAPEIDLGRAGPALDPDALDRDQASPEASPEAPQDGWSAVGGLGRPHDGNCLFDAVRGSLVGLASATTLSAQQAGYRERPHALQRDRWPDLLNVRHDLIGVALGLIARRGQLGDVEAALADLSPLNPPARSSGSRGNARVAG